MTEQKKLLWVGDAVCPTGFARVTHNVLDHLHELEWDISVMGINYRGDPHDYPYKIYPACRYGDNNMWGFERLPGIVRAIKPDVMCIIQDPWNVFAYMTILGDIYNKKLEEGEQPLHRPKICAYLPVDSENMARTWCLKLSELDRAIFYTQFGERVVRMGGYQGQSAVIPHGVDTTVYEPVTREKALKTLGLVPLKDYFVFGCVNQNQHRKRLDLTIEYFYGWLKKRQDEGRPVNDALLYLHCKTNGLYDLMGLAEYYEIKYQIKPNARLVVLGEAFTKRGGISENLMKYVYGTMNCHISTTGGEGWGLTTMESMACGVPNIIPEFGALTEWCSSGALSVPCDRDIVWQFNTIGKIANRDSFIEALDLMYESEQARQEYAQKGINLCDRVFYRWENIARMFHNNFIEVLGTEDT